MIVSPPTNGIVGNGYCNQEGSVDSKLDGKASTKSAWVSSTPATRLHDFTHEMSAEMERNSAVLADPPSNFAVDTFLANELLKLSFKDRQAIEEEIHGVRCGAAEETPELLDRSLRDFDLQLNARKIGHRVLRNVIYTTRAQAIQQPQSICYLNDQDVRLRFLRAECFDVPKAVQRLIDYLEFTCEIFGSHIADRPVSIADFKTHEEVTALRNSRGQYLPFRDRSGRRVLVGVGSCNFHLPEILLFKILMLLHWEASADLETQRKGVVVVTFPFDEGDDFSWESRIRPRMKSRLRAYHKRQNKSLPVRITSLQQYYRDTPFFRALQALYVFGLDSHHRSIYKAHFGGETELRYKLATYGIPADLLQISSTGTVKFHNHTAWLSLLHAKLDQQESGKPATEEIVDCPRSYDVIFRKGPTFRNNPGNMFYRELIETHSKEHASRETRIEKYQITLRIVEIIEKRGGRFLEWAKKKQMWTVMQDRNKVRTKVAAALKQYKRTRKDDPSEMTNSINTATAVVESCGHESDNSDVDPLRQYYSMQNHPMKRRKTECFDSNLTDNGTCFGKAFFPTD